MRPMRRRDRLATEEETLEMLKEGVYGTLSVCGNDNIPYGIPLNYAYADGAIYFHCAKTGHKIDIMNENNNVCFSVVTKSDVLEDKFSSDFKSAVVFGKAYLVEDTDERQFAFEAILHTCLPRYAFYIMAFLQILSVYLCTQPVLVSFFSLTCPSLVSTSTTFISLST